MALPGIYYSPAADRFYQPGRRGAVSDDTGIKSLIYDEKDQIFIDSRGRSIPQEVLTRQTFRSRDFISHDTEGRPFVSGTLRSRVIDPLSAEKGPINPNQDVMVRTVVTLPDGTTFVDYHPGKIGENIDPAIALDNAAKQVRKKLGEKGNASGKIWNIPTNEIKARTRASEFILRTLVLR